jgi:hypothetical protein
MDSPTSVLLDATALLRVLDAASVAGLDDEMLCRFTVELEAHGRLVDALRVAVAGEVSERSRPELGSAGLSERNGFTRGAHLLERLTRVSAAEVVRRVRLGTVLRAGMGLSGSPVESRYGVLAAAMFSGEVDTSAAVNIVRCLDQAGRTASVDDLITAESILVEIAAREPVDCVTGAARVVRDRLDPDGVRPREDEVRARREIRLGREHHGVTPISGALDPVTASLLKAAFAEANAPGAQPRFLSEQDARDGTETSTGPDGEQTIRVRDLRSRGQRQHDVFTGLIKAGIRNVGSISGEFRSTADVTAVIRLADLENGSGPGWVDGVDEPVSATTVQMLACDASYRRIILGAEGEVLHLGRTRYPFNTAQRRALAVRDGGCVFEGCSAPPSWCDAHHVREYTAHGARGRTDIDNGVLLCGEHHSFIHRSDWKLRMLNGRPQILAPFHIDPAQRWRTLGRPRTELHNTG